MRERADAICADFHLTSSPGAGTCVEVVWKENPNIALHVL
jgi:signal transduction histidine kinase